MTWYNLFCLYKKKESSVIDFDQHIEPIPVCLKNSPLYSHRLVNIHTIVHTYVGLIAKKSALNPSDCKQDCTRIQTYAEIWSAETEKVYKHAIGAAAILKIQVDALDGLLKNATSAMNSFNLVYEVQQFIVLCLKEIHAYLRNKEQISTKSMHSYFQSYHRDLEDRIQSVLLEKNDTLLNTCMEKIYRLEQELVLYQYYIESQMRLLRHLASIVHASPRMMSYWALRYQQSQTAYQELVNQLKWVLEEKLACPQDMSCVICLSPLQEPVTLKGCGHTFCKDCLQQHYCFSCSVNKKRKRLVLMPKGPLIECTCFVLDLEGQLTPVRHPPCPLCRKAFHPQDCVLDTELGKLISAYDTLAEKRSSRTLFLKNCVQYIHLSQSKTLC
ncbi:hypothetical protein BY458DRAFT_551389 [Sporodiniella umbellata]|nr:hypothetical protein BY458DRAFT_551389 [Sporodiniella umbellata]